MTNRKPRLMVPANVRVTVDRIELTLEHEYQPETATERRGAISYEVAIDKAVWASLVDHVHALVLTEVDCGAERQRAAAE